MEVTHGRDLSYGTLGAKIRGDGLSFKHLAQGVDGTPENFSLVLGKQADFYSPRHHHNFDQFRYAIQGDFNLTPTLTLQQGQLSYHPEGVYYGPQDDGPEERVLLVLQLGGASGQGYISFGQISAAREALCQTGRFEKGKYFRNDGSPPVDAHEAVSTYVTGVEKMVFPEGRYHEPICMNPESFRWRPVGAQQGGQNAWKKLLGVFSERETRVEMLKIEGKGSLTVGGGDAIELVYVLKGVGSVGGEELLQESTIKLNQAAKCEISSSSGVELLHFVMPMLSDATAANGISH
ncbi:MAG: hypothetical protein M1821_003184 [Bathelium mastoideum]|nr:MAG: hypothetical protein M1821_003184 [Bathelium mastoideum]KAI9689461.1 MAG: hypothetical protein M1822_010112 [Bathelium mastoideum]